MATLISVPNETRSTSSRITKEGKKITYELHVIQQPERARACGSGAKSSADRRPVDPPPIVELRIFEGDAQTGNEVTFSYNANFFLFATLENARTIAQGRVQAAPSSFPVLTGTPVAGMAYLDRPNPAGYFIFPDLSVRHEGKYRLSFALYEELKEPKDMDSEDHMERPRIQGNHGLDAHVSHRLEVKSMPFTVFSAKKFPGLSESTALSRMVAEQGCRVRIRRDVRMRRRDNSKKGDWDEYEDDTAFDRARAERTATPVGYGQQMQTPQPIMDGSDRPRSVSNASNASFAMPQRRPSIQDISQTYQGYPQHIAPQSQQPAYPPQMGYPAQQAPQYQNQYPPPQPQSMMQPPQPQYHPAAHHAYPPQPSIPMPQNYGYMQNQAYPSQQYEPQQQVRHEPMDYQNTQPDYRRASVAQPQQPTQHYQNSNQMMGQYGNMDSQYNRSQPMNHPTHHTSSTSAPTTNGHMTPHALAPLKTLQPPAEKIEPHSPSYIPGPITPGTDVNQHPSYHEANRAAATGYAVPQPTAGNKRAFGSTFDTRYMEQPLRQGARPSVSHQTETYDSGSISDGADEDALFAERAMSYRRADGTQRSRRIPTAN
ncbi:hypothetical protein M501DRAFT_938356 [Patellaria atrata CBS 101060]|uniref:Velvet domain-containing protein n=1 Tax=Patellaria atrata CBS 101060 TaxID=1346257 RepID=A0A9P4VQW6_9PEZI|nr:hypothetical protein M501DRAFT_938356 [Patellaria atrata CBS 101060]